MGQTIGTLVNTWDMGHNEMVEMSVPWSSTSETPHAGTEGPRIESIKSQLHRDRGMGIVLCPVPSPQIIPTVDYIDQASLMSMVASGERSALTLVCRHDDCQHNETPGRVFNKDTHIARVAVKSSAVAVKATVLAVTHSDKPFPGRLTLITNVVPHARVDASSVCVVSGTCTIRNFVLPVQTTVLQCTPSDEFMILYVNIPSNYTHEPLNEHPPARQCIGAHIGCVSEMEMRLKLVSFVFDKNSAIVPPSLNTVPAIVFMKHLEKNKLCLSDAERGLVRNPRFAAAKTLPLTPQLSTNPTIFEPSQPGYHQQPFDITRKLVAWWAMHVSPCRRPGSIPASVPTAAHMCKPYVGPTVTDSDIVEFLAGRASSGLTATSPLAILFIHPRPIVDTAFSYGPWLAALSAMHVGPTGDPAVATWLRSVSSGPPVDTYTCLNSVPTLENLLDRIDPAHNPDVTRERLYIHLFHEDRCPVPLTVTITSVYVAPRVLNLYVIPHVGPLSSM